MKDRTRLGLWVADRMPRWLVYFCAIRLGAEVTTGKYSNTVVPDITLTDALRRWAGA